jgi:hypothetical protein
VAVGSLVRHHHNLVEEAGTHARAEVVSVLPKTVLRMQTDTLPASGWSDRFLGSEVREKLQVAELSCSATCEAIQSSDGDCSIAVAFRLGTYPTGIRATSFIDLTSTAETSLVTAMAT